METDDLIGWMLRFFRPVANEYMDALAEPGLVVSLGNFLDDLEEADEANVLPLNYVRE